jgi:hypothetical protein
MSNPSPNATVGSVHQNRPVGAIPGKASARQVQQSRMAAKPSAKPSPKKSPAKTPAKKTPKKGTR